MKDEERVASSEESKDVLCLSLSPYVLKRSSIPRTVIFQPLPRRSNATHRKMAGRVCEMAPARAIPASAPRVSLLLDSFHLSSHRGIVMGPIRLLLPIFHRFVVWLVGRILFLESLKGMEVEIPVDLSTWLISNFVFPGFTTSFSVFHYSMGF